MKSRLLLLCFALLATAATAQNRPPRVSNAVDRIAELSVDAQELASDLRPSSRARRARRVAVLLDRAVGQLEDGDVDDAADYLDDASSLLDDIADDLRDDGYDGRADRADDLRSSIDAQENLLDDIADFDGSGSMREGRYVDGERVDGPRRTRRGRDWEERAEDWADRFEDEGEAWGDRIEERAERWADRWEDRWDGDWSRRGDRDDWRRRRNRFRSYAPAFVGDFGGRWPYPETSVYRSISSLRYNRVDGLTLGVRRRPLEWDSYDRAGIFGQASYALALEKWRYEIGGEIRLGDSYRSEDFDIKFGGSFRRQTTTNDLWKAGWAENTTAALLFRTDFFDYFQTEGYTLYSVARLTPLLQAAVAYRSDDYSSLSKNASWALFGGDGFRFNPAVDEGRMQSVVVSVDGGSIRGLRFVPSGVAFRAEAEFGESFAGDFSFNRYEADIRAYIRSGRDTGLALRIRGGYADGNVPLQKTFTIGGAGSVRAYPQNAFRGTSMLLANAELSLYDISLLDDILRDITVFGLADAGWVNGPGNLGFDIDDVLPAAGFGVGLNDRQIRFELAWPLRDVGTGLEPTLWLRINPTF